MRTIDADELIGKLEGLALRHETDAQHCAENGWLAREFEAKALQKGVEQAIQIAREM